jgi:hypothetical protein
MSLIGSFYPRIFFCGDWRCPISQILMKFNEAQRHYNRHLYQQVSTKWYCEANLRGLNKDGCGWYMDRLAIGQSPLMLVVTILVI